MIEVLIAIALLATMSTAAFVLLSLTFTEGLAVSERSRAEIVLSNGFEAVRQIRDASFVDLSAGTHGLAEAAGTWIFSGTEDVTDGTFTRSVTIAEPNDTTREVTVSVAWTNAAGRTETRSATTLFTEWRDEIIGSSSNCYGETATGDWSNPRVIGSKDIGAGNQGTDLVVDYPYVYISGVAASSSKPDLFVFDVSVPASPVLIDQLDIGQDGINSIAKGDGYLVAASANNSREFMVLDITDPTNVSLIGYTNLSGDTDALTVTTFGSTAYLGRDDGGTPEIYAYDLAVPGTPSLLATFESPSEINDFTRSDNYVFAATSAESQDVIVIDATDPIHPTKATTYNIASDSEAKSVAYNDPGVLFIGHEDGQFTPMDVSNPLVPIEYPPGDAGGTIQDMVCTNGQLVFLGTTNSNKEFMILDISDFNAVTEYASLNFPQVIGGLDFAANMVFAAVRSNDALRIITSSP